MEVPGKVRRQHERNSITYLASFPALGELFMHKRGLFSLPVHKSPGTRLLRMFICSPSTGSQFEVYNITDGQLATLAITA